ncbi:MAG: ribbon-helix-helix protein, CopG family [Actinobacteria bacterium]|nr:ribbon-helix-helix protein, CopG family [Actinomycetota bacterium]
MRTTIELDPDAARAVQELRRARGVGTSAAVNELIRAGLLAEHRPKPFTPRTRSMGIRIDVSNVAEALDLLDGSDAR